MRPQRIKGMLQQGKGIIHPADKGIAVALALAPILSKYVSVVPGVSLGEIALIISLTVASINHRIYLHSNTPIDLIWLYVAYIWIIIPFAFYYHGAIVFDLLTRTIRFSTYVLILVSIIRIIDWDAFISSAEFVVYLSLALLFVQYAVYYATGKYIQGYGYLLPVNTGLSSAEREQIFSYSFFRPSSFFTEPAHLCQYVYPILNYRLFKNLEGRNLIGPIAISAGLILSTSLWGFVLVGISWAAFIFSGISDRKRGIRLMVGLVLAPIIIFILKDVPMVASSIARLNFADLNDSATFSGRFLGYGEYQSFDLIGKLFGNGFGYIGGQDAIGNSIAFILLGTGATGLTLLIGWLTALFRTSDLYGRVILGEYALLLFGTASFNSLYMPVTIIASMSSLSKKAIDSSNYAEHEPLEVNND